MKVGLLYELDGLANSTRAYEIKYFLTGNDYEVETVDLCKIDFKPNNFYRKAKLRNLLSGKGWDYDFIMENIKLRAKIIEDNINKYKFDAVICGSAQNAYFLTKKLDCIKIFDCPTPWTAELKQNPDVFLLTLQDIEKLAQIELEIYKKSDYVAFHWETYADYIKKNMYSGNNIITLNWGCHPKKKRAKYELNAKIIYFGNIGNKCIDIGLLERLVKKNKMIDVYGLPEPKDIEKLNYKGYATSDILINYQFGLITMDKNDKLKCEGFSAKYLDYISFGIPVLEPEWRNVSGLSEKSILYNEDNILDQIDKYSSKDLWQKKSDEVYKLAEKLDWNITLKPLLKILK